jgi:hypothetical protein
MERAAPRFPIWPCTRWGFPCLLDYSWSGGLLPHLFTLTLPKSQIETSEGRYIFCGTFRQRASRPNLPRVSKLKSSVTRHRALWSSDFPPSAKLKAILRLPRSNRAQSKRSMVRLQYRDKRGVPRGGVIQIVGHRHVFDVPLTRPSGTLSPCGSAAGGEGWGEGARMPHDLNRTERELPSFVGNFVNAMKAFPQP